MRFILILTLLLGSGCGKVDISGKVRQETRGDNILIGDIYAITINDKIFSGLLKNQLNSKARENFLSDIDRCVFELQKIKALQISLDETKEEFRTKFKLDLDNLDSSSRLDQDVAKVFRKYNEAKLSLQQRIEQSFDELVKAQVKFLGDLSSKSSVSKAMQKGEISEKFYLKDVGSDDLIIVFGYTRLSGEARTFSWIKKIPQKKGRIDLEFKVEECHDNLRDNFKAFFSDVNKLSFTEPFKGNRPAEP